MAEIEKRGLVPSPQHLHPTTPPGGLASTAVAMETPSLVTPDDFAMMLQIAQTAVKGGSDMLPVGITTPEAALAVMLAGAEYGFTPFASLRQVFPVRGKLHVMTEGLAAVVLHRDLTARFIYHDIGDQGADVELFRGGVSVIRVKYTDAERIRARQGMKRAEGSGSEKFIPVLLPDGKTPKRYPVGDKDRNGKDRGGKIVFQINPAYDPNAKSEWVEDEESPWFNYRSDMHGWSAVKRCIKFGAPDLVNLTPLEVRLPSEVNAYFEENGGPLSRAVFNNAEVRAALTEGMADGALDDDELEALRQAAEVDDMAALVEDPGEAPGTETPPSPEAVEANNGVAARGQSNTRPPAARAAQAAAPSPEGEAVVDVETRRATLGVLLEDCKATWGLDYAPLYRELAERFGDNGAFVVGNVPAERVEEALSYLRQRAGGRSN